MLEGRKVTYVVLDGYLVDTIVNRTRYLASCLVTQTDHQSGYYRGMGRSESLSRGGCPGAVQVMFRCNPAVTALEADGSALLTCESSMTQLTTTDHLLLYLPFIFSLANIYAALP